MTQYQNALADMSNEAVEYVRGYLSSKRLDRPCFLLKNLSKRSIITSVGSSSLYEAAALAHDILYVGGEQRVCIPDCRRLRTFL